MSIFNEQNPMKSIEKENLSTLWNKIKSYVNSKIPNGSLAGKNVAPIEMGGTNAITSKDARINLGITYGTAIPTEAPTTGDGTVYFFEDGMESDYVVEINTSDIWTYRKWNSGLMECWGMKPFSTAVSSQWGPFYQSAEIQLGNFPVAFIENPGVMVQVTNANLELFISSACSTSKTSAGKCWISRPASATSASGFIGIRAIGKWR